MQYGQAAVGVPNQLLLQQKRSAAVCVVGSVGGGDLNLTVRLADGGLRGRADPAFAAHIDPIGMWAAAVWGRWVSNRALTLLVKHALRRAERARTPWSTVARRPPSSRP